MTNEAADVVVCGGGVAGTMAAVAAARLGARTVLVERYGFLGGNATAGAVAQFNSWQTAGGRTVVAGLAQEVVDRLRRYGAAGEHHRFTMSTGHTMDRVAYAPELLKLVLDDMVTDAGVQPLLHAALLDVHTTDGRATGDGDPGRHISAVQALTRGGVVTLRPRVLVDASGDMEAMKRAGAAFLPLDTDEALQPATLMFRFGPVDFERFDAIPAADRARLAQQGFDSGQLARAALHVARDPLGADGWFNIGRLAIDATDARALGQAEIEGRRQAWRAAAYLQARVPGCEAGRLVAFGTQVGVRETRRVQGEHLLTASELLQQTAFADSIAAGAYPIDVHPAQGGGLDYTALGDDQAYQIPLRSLQPLGLANALVAGRGVSATHRALAAIRVMTISMAVGQAAGTVAALAAAAAQPLVRQVPVAAVRQQLLADGAVLS